MRYCNIKIVNCLKLKYDTKGPLGAEGKVQRDRSRTVSRVLTIKKASTAVWGGATP